MAFKLRLLQGGYVAALALCVLLLSRPIETGAQFRPGGHMPLAPPIPHITNLTFGGGPVFMFVPPPVIGIGGGIGGIGGIGGAGQTVFGGGFTGLSGGIGGGIAGGGTVGGVGGISGGVGGFGGFGGGNIGGFGGGFPGGGLGGGGFAGKGAGFNGRGGL